MTDHFISDPHFDHTNIIKYSGRVDCLSGVEFKEYDRLLSLNDSRMKSLKISKESLETMNTAIIDDWNRKVKENDTLWCLGDFYIGHSKQRLVEIRNKIRCKNIHLIYGNHDQKWIRKHCPPYLFKSCSDVRFIKINNQEIFLSHYCHVIWPKSHHGTWHLFGHSHSSLNKWVEEHMPNAKCLDVGVDNQNGSYSPWSFDEVKQYMDTKQGQIVDHHQD